MIAAIIAFFVGTTLGMFAMSFICIAKCGDRTAEQMRSAINIGHVDD